MVIFPSFSGFFFLRAICCSLCLFYYGSSCWCLFSSFVIMWSNVAFFLAYLSQRICFCCLFRFLSLLSSGWLFLFVWWKQSMMCWWVVSLQALMLVLPLFVWLIVLLEVTWSLQFLRWEFSHFSCSICTYSLYLHHTILNGSHWSKILPLVL